jgi:hypothetical protein
MCVFSTIIKVSLFHPHHSLSSNNIQTGTNRIRKKIYHTCIAKHSIIIRYAGITTAIVLILSTFAFASFSIPSNEQIQTAYALPESGCIAYDAATLTITVSCKSPVSLTDIYEQLGGAENKALYKDPDNNNGVWLLNANVTIQPGSTLNIDSLDSCRWQHSCIWHTCLW